MGDDENVNRKGEGAGEHVEVAELNGEGTRHAEFPQARDREENAHDDVAVYAVSDEKPQKRHDDDVERRDEPRLSDLGVVHEPELLKTFSGKEAKPAEEGAEKKSLSQGSGRSLALSAVENEGCQKEGAEERAARREGEGTDVIHSHGLGDEGAAPNEGGEEKKEGLSERKRVHGYGQKGTLAKMQGL